LSRQLLCVSREVAMWAT